MFLSGAYLGDFTMQTVAPGDEFDVAFGVDDRVTIEREPKEIERGDTGVVGKKAKARWEWSVEVKNGHKRSIDVEIWEQIPLTSRQDVSVKLLPVGSGTPEPVKEDGGLMHFDVSVGASGKKTLVWGYQVEYPSDISLGWLE